jgi:cytochrome c biogenesis protein CcmG, thiol:disulfide interchange protein DsbE
MRAGQVAIAGAVVALLALLTYGLVSKGDDGSALALGKPPPDERLQVLGSDGARRIADYRGKWVLVNFWASWCDPCRAEAPLLERFHRRHRDRGFLVLGIDSQDLSPDARRFVRRFRLSYPQLHDGDGSLSRAYKMTGFPESFLIDPAGNLALQQRGVVDASYLERFVAPRLADS